MSAFACAAPWLPPWLDRLPAKAGFDWGASCSYCAWTPPSSSEFAALLPCSHHAPYVERFVATGGHYGGDSESWVARVPGSHPLRIPRAVGDDRPTDLAFFYVQSRGTLYGVGTLRLFALIGCAWPAGIQCR